MSIIAALLPNPDRLRRLQTAIRGRHQIAPCADWGALHRLCETQPVSTAVFDLFATGEMGLEPVRQLRRLFPRLITVAYVAVGNHDRIRDVFDAGRAGIDGLVLVDRDDTAERFAALLEQAEARSVASKLKALFADMHPLVRPALNAWTDNRDEVGRGPSLARAGAALLGIAAAAGIAARKALS